MLQQTRRVCHIAPMPCRTYISGMHTERKCVTSDSIETHNIIPLINTGLRPFQGHYDRWWTTTAGRPKGVPPSRCITIMQSIAPPSFYSGKLYPPKFSTQQTHHIKCSTCEYIPQTPFELLCGNNACLQFCCKFTAK